jgi:hypothetical protein
MAKSRQPAKPKKETRLTARQREVLGQVAKGKSVAPKKGKRIELTLKSLRKRGLIEPAGTAAPGKPIVYRATAAGLKRLEMKAKPERKAAQPKTKKAKKTAAHKARAAPTRVVSKGITPSDQAEVTTFEPRVGQLVWRVDGGQRDPAYYRVVKARVIDAKLETWRGDSWAPITAWQIFEVLEPLTDAELATAKRNGVDVG